LLSRCLAPVQTLRKRPRWALACAAFALAALAGGGWWVWNEYDKEQDARGYRLAKAGRFAEALPLLERQHRRRSNDVTVLLELASCRAALGQLENAQECLQKAIDLQPRNGAALLQLGRLSLESEQGELAESWLRKALAIDPTDRRAHHLLLQSLQMQGKEALAKEQFATLERLRADLARASAIMSDALKQRPHDADLHHELGALLLRNGQVRLGLEWLERALEIDRRHRPTRDTLASYYDKIGQPQLAAEYRRKLP